MATLTLLLNAGSNTCTRLVVKKSTPWWYSSLRRKMPTMALRIMSCSRRFSRKICFVFVGGEEEVWDKYSRPKKLWESTYICFIYQHYSIPYASHFKYQSQFMFQLFCSRTQFSYRDAKQRVLTHPFWEERKGEESILTCTKDDAAARQ